MNTLLDELRLSFKKKSQDIAKKRIQQCIEKKEMYLHLSDIGLTELPDNIPDTITRLDCSYNQLETLPNKLPKALKYLNCSHNRLKSFPNNLPITLRVLNCSHNCLVHLNNLPKLETLRCHENLLVKVPSLPRGFVYGFGSFMCHDNPYMTITHENTNMRGSRFYYGHISTVTAYLNETPNYIEITRCIGKICLATKRIKRLRFCVEFDEHADEFRHRPGGAGCAEVKERNKGKWIDL